MERVRPDELQWSHDPTHWTKRPDPPPGSGPPTPRGGWDAEIERLAAEERQLHQEQTLMQNVSALAEAYNNIAERAAGDGESLAEGTPDPEITGTGEPAQTGSPTTSTGRSPGPELSLIAMATPAPRMSSTFMSFDIGGDAEASTSDEFFG